MVVDGVSGLEKSEDDRPAWRTSCGVAELVAESEYPTSNLRPTKAPVHPFVIADGRALVHRDHAIVPPSRSQNTRLCLPSFPVRAVKVGDTRRRGRGSTGQMQPD